MAQRRFRSATIYEGIVRMTTRSFLYALGDARAEAASLAVALGEGELTVRRAARVPSPSKPLGGLLEKYAATVGPARRGAVTHSGAVHWERDS